MLIARSQRIITNFIVVVGNIAGEIDVVVHIYVHVGW